MVPLIPHEPRERITGPFFEMVASEAKRTVEVSSAVVVSVSSFKADIRAAPSNGVFDVNKASQDVLASPGSS